MFSDDAIKKYKDIFGEDDLLKFMMNPDKSQPFFETAERVFLNRGYFLNVDTSRFVDLRYHAGWQGRYDSQVRWHIFVGQHFNKCSILDIGAGLGQSKKRLEAGNNTVTLQDVFPGANVDITKDTWTIPDKSYDVVTAFDVIEHIVDDWNFLEELVRIARKNVVLTTPNRLVFNCGNKYHVREYSPREFDDLLGKYNRNFFAGNTNEEPIQYLDSENFRQTDKQFKVFCGIVDLENFPENPQTGS